MQPKRIAPEGIRARHSRSCATAKDKQARCNCEPTYEASVYDARESRRLGRVVKIRKTFSGPGALAAAKGWRRDAAAQAAAGELRFERKQRLEDAVAEWLEKCERGEVLSKRRTRYAPATLRDYRHDLEQHVFPAVGHVAFTDVRPDDVQAIVDRLNGEGFSGQTVRNVVVALGAFYRHVRRRVPVNPTRELDLPEPGAKRDRAADTLEAARLVDALDGLTRDVYAAAFYSGLRRGELQALRVGDVDLDGGYVSVALSWDQVEGAKPPKSAAGVRLVPLAAPLRAILERRCVGRPSSALVFGRTDTEPFVPNGVRRDALGSWAAAAVGAFFCGESAGLDPIGLHEARHSFASWLADAGIPGDRRSRYLGHSAKDDGAARVTGGYTHALAGQLDRDRVRLDEYLAGTRAGKIVALAV